MKNQVGGGEKLLSKHSPRFKEYLFKKMKKKFSKTKNDSNPNLETNNINPENRYIWFISYQVDKSVDHITQNIENSKVH